MGSKPNRYYSEEFKRQIVELAANGKSHGEIQREYKVTKTKYGNGSSDTERAGSSERKQTGASVKKSCENYARKCANYEWKMTF